MIICKRPAPPDDHLQEAGPTTTTTTGLTEGVTWVSGVTMGGGTEGGEEGKGEGGERGREEEGKLLRTVRMGLKAQ